MEDDASGNQPRPPTLPASLHVRPLALHINFQLRYRGYPDILFYGGYFDG